MSNHEILISSEKRKLPKSGVGTTWESIHKYQRSKIWNLKLKFHTKDTW